MHDMRNGARSYTIRARSCIMHHSSVRAHHVRSRVDARGRRVPEATRARGDDAEDEDEDASL